MSAAPDHWPVALRLLSGCLGPGLSDDTRALCGRMGAADWHALVHLACVRHRVAPVLALHLDALDMPPAIAETLRTETRSSTIETLRQCAALKQLLADLGEAGASPVVLKGIPLAEHLYGGAGNRHARDIDILIAPEEIRPAASVLDRHGYRPAPPYGLRGRLVGTRALAQECYDLEYVGGRGHLSVELHWRTSHYAGWPDLTRDAALTRDQDTTIGPVRVLSDTANAMYLAGHGAMHAWARLKWLADLGRLAEARGSAALAEDLALARRMGGHIPLELGLRLAHRVMGTPLADGMAAAPSASTARLLDQMLRVIAAPEITPGSWRYRVSANVLSLQLADGPAQIGGVLRYALWRRMRLGAAGLLQTIGLKPALQ